MITSTLINTSYTLPSYHLTWLFKDPDYFLTYYGRLKGEVLLE